MDYPAQGNPYNTLPPSEWRGLQGRRYRVRSYADLYPLLFIAWGNREIFFRDTYARRVSIKVTSEVRFSNQCVLDDVKCEGFTYRAIGTTYLSITQYLVHGTPYNTTLE